MILGKPPPTASRPGACGGGRARAGRRPDKPLGWAGFQEPVGSEQVLSGLQKKEAHVGTGIGVEAGCVSSNVPPTPHPQVRARPPRPRVGSVHSVGALGTHRPRGGSSRPLPSRGSCSRGWDLGGMGGCGLERASRGGDCSRGRAQQAPGWWTCGDSLPEGEGCISGGCRPRSRGRRAVCPERPGGDSRPPAPGPRADRGGRGRRHLGERRAGRGRDGRRAHRGKKGPHGVGCGSSCSFPAPRTPSRGRGKDPERK